MTNLADLTQPDRRDALVADLADLTRSTIDAQSGLSGAAIKTAVKGVTKVDESIIERGINKLLPQLLDALQPLWDSYEADASGSFGQYLGAHEAQATEALLAVGDKNTDKLPSAMSGVYKSMRGKAEKIVGPALPQLGDVIEKHAK